MIAKSACKVFVEYAKVAHNHHEGLAPLAMLVEREDLDDLAPSWASCSKKSDHNPANDSFLPLPSSGKNSVESAGVLGVRCQGDTGVLRLGFEAPGRARPACSRCSKRD